MQEKEGIMPTKYNIKPSRELNVGDALCCRGDVTQLNYLMNVAPEDLEARLGYEPGRLRLGWYLLLLEQNVRLGEFIWGGTTEFSGGTDPVRTEMFQGETYRIPVEDLKRFDLFKQSGFHQVEAETALHTFLSHELRWLNDRVSHNRIAKVLPVIGHDNEKFWLTQYPDAARGRGVKQWTLRAAKNFRVGAKLRPGGKYLGGGRIGIGSAD